MLSNEEMDLSNTLKANLYQIPQLKHQFNLVIGSDNAGKSSLFSASKLKMIQTITNDDLEINSWHDDESIFLELPQKIIQSKTLLKSFLKQIKKYRRKPSIDSVLMCIDIYNAMQEAPKPFVKYLQNLAKELTCLNDYYKQKVALHLIFTHMDKVAGFCHSFDDSTGPWGYLFKPYINHASLLKQNSKNHESLLKNLHSSLLLKLHSTEDKLTRYLIREFPLQMESIGNLVNACVNHLSVDSSNTMGVYFTCAYQSNSAHDRLTANISQTYSLSLKNQVPQSSIEQSYFIEGMINQIKSNKTGYQKKKAPKNCKYVAALTGLMVFSFGAHHYLTSNHMNTAYQELSTYNQSSKDSFDELVPALEHLSKANQSLNKMHGTIPLKNLNALSEQINQQYKDGLNKEFLPRLAEQLVDTLSQSKKPADIYNALKAYIMLGSEKHKDPAYLKQWFSTFWQNNQMTHFKEFTQLLDEALTKNFKAIQTDENLIQASRSYLQALPQSFLYFQLVEPSLPKTIDKITLSNFNTNEIAIPSFYKKENLVNIHQQLLPKISLQFFNDEFVLYNKNNELKKVIQNAYLENYHSFWQRVTSKVNPSSFQSYQMASQAFNALNSNNSGIETVFTLIQKNTRSFPDPKNLSEKEFNRAIASHFTSTNMFNLNQIQNLRALFSDLSQYFETLNNSDNIEQQAFEIAKNRFAQIGTDPISRLMNLEKQMPIPLSRWTKTLATNTWYLLLKDAQSHVNNQWQQLIYNQYKQAIYNHFPFSESEDNEVSPETFTQFFGHHGSLSQFFENYLSPFIDTTSAKWQPKTLDGLQLPIHEATIKELIRANLIREMFFKYNNEQPSIKFTLHALELEPIIQDLTIIMNGQKLTETQENKRSLEFQWPGTNNQFVTQLDINNISGENYNKTESGYWGWFKLLKKSRIEPYGEDMTNFQLTLDVNGNASRFLMITGTQMNPFIPGLLEHFSLPDKIA